MAIKITGVGSYIPQQKIPNNSFLKNDFYTEDKQQYKADNEIIIKKFKHITGISERRYAKDHGHLKAKQAQKFSFKGIE